MFDSFPGINKLRTSGKAHKVCHGMIVIINKEKDAQAQEEGTCFIQQQNTPIPR